LSFPTHGIVGNANPFIANQYSTYSGADIVCSITVPILTNDPVSGNIMQVSRPVTIANLQTISVSSHRDKFPVRAFKSVNPRGFTRGPRTIAGSLIFTMFDRDSLVEVQLMVKAFYQKAQSFYADAYGNAAIPSLIPTLRSDELPPFDVTITMANESGQSSVAKVLGIEILDAGHVMSIDDLFIEETMSFMARDFYPMFPANPFNVTSDGDRS
jgi:hypothetical protein